MITKELIQKARQAQSPEELVELSKGTDDELTLEKAQEVFAKLQDSGELSDEELDNVAGGCGRKILYPSINSDNPVCPYDGGKLKGFNYDPVGYDVFMCSTCGRKFRHTYECDSWSNN